MFENPTALGWLLKSYVTYPYLVQRHWLPPSIKSSGHQDQMWVNRQRIAGMKKKNFKE